MPRKRITFNPATPRVAGPVSFRRERGLGRAFPLAIAGVVLALTMITVAACGSSDSDDEAGDIQPTAAAPADTPTSAPTPEPTAGQAEAPTAEPAPEARAAGEVEGITFTVDEGSEATFTVREELTSVPLPFDAVIRTTALSGEVHMDGRDSVIEIDLLKLKSDNTFRDRYIHSRMFGEHPTGVVTIRGVSDLPGGFASGETVTGEVDGELQIRGVAVPLTFEIEARDDGNVVFILGRTTFTWDELQIPKPTARSVVSLDDEVRVEVLLSVTPVK